ncbi:hypothetical protein [Reichenbachiella versicolor]|uniref:hypothetical protein n=1 Tax=Reichenbachiella versicolor TaxID=1821036 RepID=UPI000D6E68F2|nr:hypothetical protein [Reichenbachiella versicolor]
MLDNILFIKELLELGYSYRKPLLIITLSIFAIFVLLVSWGSSIHNEYKSELINEWNNLTIGDSIFVKKNVYQLKFYKKGRRKLEDYEQRQIKYRREDTVDFCRVNSVHEKFFFKKQSSFVGICLDKDSSMTEAGRHGEHLWVSIMPRYEIANPPKSDKYDFKTRTWSRDRTNYNYSGLLSNEFYVNFNDIQLINNDSNF